MSSKALCLDASSFPHILDSVIDLSDIGTKLVLRSTCKALRDKIDPMIFHHVVLDGTSPTRPDRFHFPVGYVLNPEKHLLRHVHIVDRVILERLDVTDLSPFFTNLKTVRLFEGASGIPAEPGPTRIPLPATEYIFFTCLVPRVGIMGAITNACVGPCHAKTTRIVINASVHRTNRLMMFSSLVFSLFPDTLQHLTVIFRECPAPYPEEELHRLLGSWGDTNILRQLRFFMGQRIPAPPQFECRYGFTTFTFVNFDMLVREWLGREFTSTPTVDIKTRLTQVLVDDVLQSFRLTTTHPEPWMGPEWRDVAVQMVADGVEFLSLEEYRVRIGDKQFELETVPG
ncbi:uncharacterized protein EHS24_001660 [Apiotrichum porosum]|uniref:Uncharacterized protein n=1 Tax=Apiotrichum porosum TaxID=105984 RepID=A0A427XJ13_9TREE|nr:uncharacterized protein EHS24_001660 [Apiotrichum porosum]RSH78754.1 hypothetical protein EHS24_001660 [Apiotrichum porosum]